MRNLLSPCPVHRHPFRSAGKKFLFGALALGFLAWDSGLVSHAATFTDWPSRQQIEVPGTGLVKFKLAVETLNAARPDLRDLRVLDAGGNEVPFVIERPVPSNVTIRNPKTFRATLTAETTVLHLETGLTQKLAGVTLQTPSVGFLKSGRLEGSTDQLAWRTLAADEPIFRQTEGVSQLQLSFPPQDWAYLRLTIDDRRSPPVPFTGATLHQAETETLATDPLTVPISERSESAGETRLMLRLDGANLRLAALTIDTPDPLFTRQVTLTTREWDGESVRETPLASGAIYRVEVEGQPVAARLEFPIERQTLSRELLLLIRNGDSPPLPINGVRAAHRPDYLVFFARTMDPHTLLLGNPRATAPQYDLAALNVNLKMPAASSTAFSTITANPDFRPMEAMPEIPALGATLDLSSWAFRKPVHVAQTGIQQVELDLDVLARAQPSLADLRLVSGGQQVPFMLERTSIARSLSLRATTDNNPNRPTATRWTLKLPRAGLPVSRLTSEPQTTLFQRLVHLYEEALDDRGQKYRRALGSATWTQTPDRRTKQLTLAFDTAPQTDTLILETENGDNPPITLANFQAL